MTFEFDEDGFLTARRHALESGIRAAHDRLFARSHQINRDCHELLFAADIRNRDVQAMLVATLFMRALEHYQATLVLLGMGLIAPAKVTLRATLEFVFTTRAVAVDEKALGAFINADLLQRRKLINKARQHDHTNLELREATTDEFIERLEQEIKASGAKPLKVEDLSKLAGMHDWYTTCYSLLSSATHTNVRELDDYLSRDQAGEIRSLTYAPAMKEIPDLLLTAAHCILLGTVAVSQTFAVDFQAKGTDHLKCIEAEFASLGANTERST